MPDLAEWRRVFAAAQGSAFCRGEIPRRDGGTPWRVTFDWVIKNDDHPVRIMEGNYQDRTPAVGAVISNRTRDNLAARVSVIARLKETGT
jgi:hypothetical protein